MKRILFLVLFTAGWMVTLSLSATLVFAQTGTKASTVAPAVVAPAATTSVVATPAAPIATPESGANPALDALSKRVSNLENNFKVEIHGFAELDIFNDDTHSFTEVIGSGPVKFPNSLAGLNGWTMASMRDSRLSFLATAPEIDGWKTKGYVEVDFKGYDPSPVYKTAASGAPTSPTEASFFYYPTLGLRHAYVGAEKDGWNIMAGQYWTLFGWDMGYILSSVSVAPLPGVIYERTPQLRVSKTMILDDLKVQLAVAADRPEERDSQVPNMDAGLKLSYTGWKGRYVQATGPVNTVPLSLAISGTVRNYVWPTESTSLVETNNVWCKGIAGDAMIPLVPYDEKEDSISVIATGEYSQGFGYGDVYPNWTGGLTPMVSNYSGTATGTTGTPNLDCGIAGYDANSNFKPIQLASWNGQIQVNLPKSIGTCITAGYGELFSPNVGGLTSTLGTAVLPYTLYNDDAVEFANIMQDVTPNIRVAVEYALIDTHYANLKDGAIADSYDNRMQFSAWYRF